MAFSEELVAQLYCEQEEAVAALNALLLQTVQEAQAQENAQAKSTCCTVSGAG
ncbi:hypothetical protein [Achromobacter aloeverae]